MKAVSIFFAAGASLLVAASAGAQMGGMMRGRGMMGGPRHAYVMRNGVDPQYARMTNPLRASAANLEQGRKLYEGNCAACHGAAGLGDGAAGKALNPPAALLAGLSRSRIASDGFYYWAIAEGGAPVGSAMPPFKGTLKDTEIWKIVLFLRQL